MEAIVERMQDPHSGVVVRTVKSFMSKIPSVFTGLSPPYLSVSFYGCLLCLTVPQIQLANIACLTSDYILLLLFVGLG